MSKKLAVISRSESAIASAPSKVFDQAVKTYLAGRSANTRESYRARLHKFMTWYRERSAGHFVEHLKDYINYLQALEMSPRSVQAHINTIKGMLRTAAALDLSGQIGALLPSLDLAKPPVVRGEVQGRQLTSKQRQALLAHPGTATHKGRRDTAVLALMADCGLRRSEVASLEWRHIAELDGHKVIQNLSGKHGRVRTIKLPVPLWRLIAQWGELAALDTSPNAPVFLPIRRGDHVQRGQRLKPNGVADICTEHCEALGFSGITPHDLRRTAAKLARQHGASIEQVQIMLGHASPQTTSAYIGETLDLDNHAIDFSDVDYTQIKVQERMPL